MSTIDQHRDPAREIAAIIAEALGAQALGVKGEVRVEILDERGRIIDCQESPNYVNAAQWTRFAQYVQRLVWSYGMLASGGVTKMAHDRDPRQPPALFNEIIACWTDTTAQNTADVHAFGEIVAWAHRWGQGSPSTRQGLVQPSLCQISETVISWVWEWTSANGNGTFQSVGWRRIGWTAATGDPTLYDFANFSRRLSSATGYVNTIINSSAGHLSININGAVIPCMAGPYYNQGDGAFYVVSEGTTAGNAKLMTIPVTIDAFGNYTLGTTSDQSANVIAAGVGGDNVAQTTRRIMGLTRLGASGDWIAVGNTTSGGVRQPTIRRVTAGGSVTYTNANGATFSSDSTFADVTYDGTNVYAVGWIGSGTVSKVYRIDPSTGTVSAAITPTGFPANGPGSLQTTTTFITGVEWDAANGWLWCATKAGYLFNMDTSGNWLGVLLSTATPTSLTLTSPQSGTSSDYSGLHGRRDVDSYNPTFSSISSTTDPFSQTVAAVADTITPALPNAHLWTMDGDVWATFGNQGNNGDSVEHMAGGAFTDEPNFSSRTILGSPAVKSSGETMRIRYTITLI